MVPVFPRLGLGCSAVQRLKHATRDLLSHVLGRASCFVFMLSELTATPHHRRLVCDDQPSNYRRKNLKPEGAPPLHMLEYAPGTR